MGTRGFMGFASGDTVKVSYNHFDSYPEHLGRVMFDWALSADLDEAKEKLALIELVDESASPTPEQIEKLKAAGFQPSSVSTGMDFYSWLRDCQGNPKLQLRSPYMNDGSAFVYDPGYIEWGYIVDLDERVLEVYCGYRSAGLPSRFTGDGRNPLPLVLKAPLDGSMNNEAFITAALNSK